MRLSFEESKTTPSAFWWLVVFYRLLERKKDRKTECTRKSESERKKEKERHRESARTRARERETDRQTEKDCERARARACE